jgi:hypothetical protein
MKSRNASKALRDLAFQRIVLSQFIPRRIWTYQRFDGDMQVSGYLEMAIPAGCFALPDKGLPPAVAKNERAGCAYLL